MRLAHARARYIFITTAPRNDASTTKTILIRSWDYCCTSPAFGSSYISGVCSTSTQRSWPRSSAARMGGG